MRNGWRTWTDFQKEPQKVFCKKAVLKHFAIFTGKHLCWSPFLIKLQAFSPAIVYSILAFQLFNIFINFNAMYKLDPVLNINPLSTNAPLLYPLKTSENWRFSNVSKGYRSRTLVENGFNMIRISENLC